MQKEWWYSIDGLRRGPVSIADIRTLLLEGGLSGGNLIWTEGMTEWSPLANMADFDNIARAVPPDIPQRSASDLLASLPEAGSWRRFYARGIDVSIFYIIIIASAPLFSNYLFGITPKVPGMQLVLSTLLTAVILILDAAIFGIFGTTAGKYLLAVEVLTADGRPPTAAQYLRRQAGVYWYGYAAGIHILVFLTMIYQFRRLKSGKKTSYDEGRFHVKSPKRGPIGFIGILAGITIYAIFLSIIYMKYTPTIITPKIDSVQTEIGVE